MAVPITTIQKTVLSEEQEKLQKLDHLQAKIAQQEEALNNLLSLIGELNSLGLLEAANAMLQAKEEVAKIALNQVTREPVTHLINHVMGGAEALSSLNPELTKNLINGITNGLEEGNAHLKSQTKITLFDLMKTIKDPDFNRALGFGIQFMKGLGKTLNEK